LVEGGIGGRQTQGRYPGPGGKKVSLGDILNQGQEGGRKCDMKESVRQARRKICRGKDGVKGYISNGLLLK